jgi:hypothetical protein
MPPAIITSRAQRIKARTIEAAIRHLKICIEIEKKANLIQGVEDFIISTAALDRSTSVARHTPLLWHYYLSLQ